MRREGGRACLVTRPAGDLLFEGPLAATMAVAHEFIRIMRTFASEDPRRVVPLPIMHVQVIDRGHPNGYYPRLENP